MRDDRRSNADRQPSAGIRTSGQGRPDMLYQFHLSMGGSDGRGHREGSSDGTGMRSLPDMQQCQERSEGDCILVFEQG